GAERMRHRDEVAVSGVLQRHAAAGRIGDLDDPAGGIPDDENRLGLAAVDRPDTDQPAVRVEMQDPSPWPYPAVAVGVSEEAALAGRLRLAWHRRIARRRSAVTPEDEPTTVRLDDLELFACPVEA